MNIANMPGSPSANMIKSLYALAIYLVYILANSTAYADKSIFCNDESSDFLTISESKFSALPMGNNVQNY